MAAENSAFQYKFTNNANNIKRNKKGIRILISDWLLLNSLANHSFLWSVCSCKPDYICYVYALIKLCGQHGVNNAHPSMGKMDHMFCVVQ